MGGNNSLGPLLLLFALGLFVFTIMRGRRAQREAAATQSSLAPGTEIMTTSGMFATVVDVEDGVVTLETGPGQTSRWDKRAVARIVSAPGGPVEDRSGDADDSTDGAAEPGGDAPPHGRE